MTGQQYDAPEPRAARVFLLASRSPRPGDRRRYPAYDKSNHMTNWPKLVAEHYAKAHPDGDCDLVTRPGASIAQLDDLSALMGISLPKDFRDLYSTYDGFGIANDAEPDRTWWLFRPTSQLAQFTDDVRGWFAETHKKYADRFYPFIDFSNGDGVGYMLDESGAIIDALFCFQHENYEFDEEQDVNEFITQWSGAIEGFLTQIAE